jgi:hypothetical protein
METRDPLSTMFQNGSRHLQIGKKAEPFDLDKILMRDKKKHQNFIKFLPIFCFMDDMTIF